MTVMAQLLKSDMLTPSIVPADIQHAALAYCGDNVELRRLLAWRPDLAPSIAEELLGDSDHLVRQSAHRKFTGQRVIHYQSTAQDHLLELTAQLLAGRRGAGFAEAAGQLIANPYLPQEQRTALLEALLDTSDYSTVRILRTNLARTFAHEPQFVEVWQQRYARHHLDTLGWAAFPGRTPAELLTRWHAEGGHVDYHGAVHAGLSCADLLALPCSVIIKMLQRVDIKGQMALILSGHLGPDVQAWRLFDQLVVDPELTFQQALDTVVMALANTD